MKLPPLSIKGRHFIDDYGRTVILTINGSGYSQQVTTTLNGYGIWNIILNLPADDYDINLTIPIGEFKLTVNYLNITLMYRNLNYSGLGVADYGHILIESPSLTFGTAYVGNDLYLTIYVYDNYTNNALNDATVKVIINLYQLC